MRLEIIKPGLASSIQDLGRVGFGRFGVPGSGPMDHYSARFANILLDNPKNAAVLECFLQGPAIRFYEETSFSISGLEAECFLNNSPIAINRINIARKKDVLELRKVTKGNWIYLAVSGGFKTEKILGSRSLYPGITPQAFLRKGDLLKKDNDFKALKNTFSIIRFEDFSYSQNRLQAFPGPEFRLLSEEQKDILFQKKFSPTEESNRMAFPLKEKLKNNLENMLTDPVLPGTVQLTPSGTLIVLMRDCQTTGGYPRILQLSEKSMDILAQKRPGDKFEFELINYKSLITKVNE